MDYNLILPAFIAGLLTFLAPCTLPLVPGYLGFISGVSFTDLADPLKAAAARRRIFKNGLLYVLGFSAVFIVLGSLFGLGGAAFIKYRVWLSQIGGAFVIFFGLYMLGLVRLPSFKIAPKIQPGTPLSSFLFGATFAFGWSPCVGPILGSILFLASASATVASGAFLLFIFSLGLGVPFLLIALGIGRASKYLGKLSRATRAVSIIGGIFIVFLGILLLTDKFAAWLGYAYELFDFLDYNKLLDYL